MIHGTPEIFNTDQGSQFTSCDFTDVLKAHEIKISMDGKGRWMDFYNHQKPHSTLHGQTPDEVYNKRNFVPPALGYALQPNEQKTALAA